MQKYKLFGVILEASSKQDAVLKWKKASSILSNIKESSSFRNMDSSALGALDAINEFEDSVRKKECVIQMLTQIVEDQQDIKKTLLSDLVNAVLKSENKN